MREQIGDESVYLRVSELKKGNIQLTDSTNASRLVREHGRDIRYNAAWKKWLVWGGTHWQVDEGGALIHEKNLETVRKPMRNCQKPMTTASALKLKNTP